MDYTTLTSAKSVDGSIARWVNDSNVQGASATIVQEAEAYIYRRLRHFKMLTSTTGTMTIGSDAVAPPADFLEAKLFYITGTSTFSLQEIKQKTPQEVVAAYSYDANGNRIQDTPQIYCFDKSNLLMDNQADIAYPYLLWYYQQPTALSTAITNFLTSTYPRLVRCACMAGAAEFIKDSGQGNIDRTYWLQQADAEILIAQTESDRAARAAELGMILL